ncbi:ATP-binding cassette domain-containing protein [Peptoniphilus sp.]|jgi:ATP-binding cassette subfamily B protein|uniref:ATP-binding cassette domain-containing protein n=1 Tax=Peptoniphilus sp. TaxID=1971214 RepID=UPI003D8C9B7A
MDKVKNNFNIIYKEFFKFSKKGAVAFLINAILEPLPSFLIAILSKSLLNFLTNNRELNFILKYLLSFVVFLFAINVVINLTYNILWPIVVNFRFQKLTELGQTAMNLDYSLLEDYEVMEEFEIAKSSSSDNQNGFAGYIFNLSKTFKGIISFILNGLVLIFYLPLLIIPAILLFVHNLKKSLASRNKTHEIKDMITKDFDRKEEYINSTIWDFSTGKEIRIFNISSMLLNKLEKIFGDKNKNVGEILKIEKDLFISNNILWIVFEIITYLYIFILFASGRLQVDSIVMLIMVFSLFQKSLSDISDDFSKLYQNSLEIENYFSFVDKYPSGKEENSRKIKISRIDSVEFKNVWFRYSKKSPYVLKNINFSLKNNEKLAIVGINGSGKSTIIKLLLNFYKQDKGQILINGFDINDIEKKSLYSLVSSMFQESIIYSFPVAQNVAMSDSFDKRKVISALEEANIYKEIDKFDENIDKMMLRLIDDKGFVPSGGQSQKINFARSLYRDSDLLILDEPSAFLDPFSEEKMIRSITDATKDKMAIYISHRLTTVKFCDKIILLKDGGIIERGNCDEMIDKKAQFYNMYMSQKKLFVKQ